MQLTVTKIELKDNDGNTIPNEGRVETGLIGKVFESEEAMDEAIGLIESVSDSIMDVTFTEELSEEEEEEEWDETLMSAMRQSDETGEKFDHIMGRVLAGIN